jgi:hypothetical protein
MNLQDILNYRSACIHCGRPLTMRVARYPKLLIEHNNSGLVIKSPNQGGVFLNFNFDGAYERSKRNYEIHKNPVYIKKYCKYHPLFNKYKGVTLDGIKDTTCHYAFSVLGNKLKSYVANMEYEGIAWCNDDEFWHMNSFYSKNESHIYHGLYSQTIGQVLHLKLPIINLSGTKTEEQYLNKMKLYALFS